MRPASQKRFPPYGGVVPTLESSVLRAERGLVAPVRRGILLSVEGETAEKAN